MEHHASNVSQDLVWEIVRSNNAFLVKRKSGGGSQFSRDPHNLMNKHSRKYAGFVNNKALMGNGKIRIQAVGVVPGEKGGVKLLTKKTKHFNRPASNQHEVTWNAHTSGPKIYKGVVNHTAKQGYRADLRQEAVARASAIRMSQKPKKEGHLVKLRGAKARQAEEKGS